MELNNLFKNILILSSTKIFRFIVGIIRSKISALILGTTGIGIINQLNNAIIQVQNVTILSMNDGVVKKIAENREDHRLKIILADLIKTYSVIIFVFGSFIIILAYFFVDELSLFFLGSLKYKNYFLICFLSVPFLLINSIFFSILKGLRAIKLLAKGELLILIIGLFIFVPLIFLWGLNGAIVYITFSYLIIMLSYRYYAKKYVLDPLNIKTRDLLNGKFSNDLSKSLFVFAGFGLTTGLFSIFSDVFTRSIVVNNLGVKKIGLYSPIVSWSSIFIGILVPSLNNYLFPRFSEIKEKEKINGIINDVFRLTSFFLIPFVFLGISLRHILIPLFYSNEFLEAEKYLPWHFLGLIFIVWIKSLQQVYIPQGKIKTHGILVIINDVASLFLVWFFVPIYGLYGYLLKFSLLPLMFFGLNYYYSSNIFNIHLDIRNIKIMIFLVVGGLFLTLNNFTNLMNIVASILLFICSIIFLDHNERSIITKKIRNISFKD